MVSEMWKFIAAVALQLVACGISQADEASNHDAIFGISMGKPITLPTCADGREAICVAKIGVNDFELRFPDTMRPSWVREVFVTTGGDVVRQLLIDTDPAQQQTIVETLNEKYGKPQSLRAMVKQSRYISIASIEATWHVQGFNVSFTGAESIQAGTLAFKSENGEASDTGE